MTRRVIGLHGRARVGKDTVGDLLRKQHDFMRATFAQPIKDALMVAFALQPADFIGDRKEAPIDWLGQSPRFLMQTLGTEWGRDIVGPDTWIRRLDGRLKYYGERVVITDVRFPNEAAWIRSLGGEIWHIERRPSIAVREHTSESGVERLAGDTVIDNNGTLDELEAQVAMAIARATPREVQP